MTFENFTRNYLFERGMIDPQIQFVIEMAKTDSDNIFDGTMVGRWNDNMGDYPEVTTLMFPLLINVFALKYIDDNCPKAWFRPCFAS
jgi:hypothetical protein